jgi:uncharacterized Fe-S cluster protein YjdI
MTIEERHRPEVLREYEGRGITVHWEPKLCIHVGRCLRDLPQVFDNAARPWVNVAAATADAIAEAIEDCPTGALRYTRTDGADQERGPVPVQVEPRPNGPLFVRGEIEVIDARGNLQRTATRAALCRCGQSASKPYCDLSHQRAGFEAP